MVTIVKQALKEGKEKRIKAFHGSPHDLPAVDMVVHKKTGKAYYIETDQFGSYKNHPVIKKFPDQYEFVDHFPQGHFDSSHIGTGEGAQAYGHGLYFAESEATAKSYREALDPKNKVLSDSYDYATRALKNNRGDVKEAIKELQAKSDSDLTGGGNRMALGAIRLLEEGFDPKRNKATMYEVNIDASPDELLDFDTPLKNQPKEMQEKVFSVFKGDLDAKISAETVKRMEEFIDNNPILAPNKDSLLPKVEPSMREKLLESNGQEILRNIATHEPIEQAEALHKAGIKGIKYADAQTRFSTKGKTHNYVIFDDKLIDIAKKYGLTLPVATAVMGGAMRPEEAEASLLGLGSKAGKLAEDLLGMAKKMENEGVPPRDIWQKTGWERNQADGQWRREHTNFDNTKINIKDEGTFSVKEIIDDPVLLSQYDDIDMPKFDVATGTLIGARDGSPLTDLQIKFDPKAEAGSGSLSDGTITVGTKKSLNLQGDREDHIRDTILHELQHAIQEREGFARGGNTREFDHSQYLYNEKYKNHADQVDKRIAELEQKNRMELTIEEAERLDTLKAIREQMNRYLTESNNNTSEPFEMYQNLVGEVEARNVSTRDAIGQRHGGDKLKNRPPESTETIMDASGTPVRPRNSQIVRYGADNPLQVDRFSVSDETSERVKKGLPLFTAGGLTFTAGSIFAPQSQAAVNEGYNGVSDEQFQALMDEEARLSADYKEKGISSWGRASPELAKYRRSQILPSLANSGVGLVDDILAAGDFFLHGGLFGKYNRSKTGEADPRTLQDSAVGKAVDNTVFGDPRDKEAIEESRTVGTFLNPFPYF